MPPDSSLTHKILGSRNMDVTYSLVENGKIKGETCFQAAAQMMRSCLTRAVGESETHWTSNKKCPA